MNDELWCPRRNEIGQGAFPGPDHWREESSSYHLGPTCSYCGSLSPESLFELIAAGAKIGPTDKSYKIYVDATNPTPDEIRYVGGGSSNIVEPQPGWVRAKDMTAEQRAIAKRDGALYDYDPERWMAFGPSGPTSHGKFYFQHLDEVGQLRFLELYNSKAITLGDPGYFYALPFFMRRAEVPA
ncbi:MAG: hypothetical protein QOJ81_2188 [Chloroflexota bacterium]|nr:hypothetical protein [Chloroflexota bacterium]